MNINACIYLCILQMHAHIHTKYIHKRIQTHISKPNSRLNQSNFQGESAQSGHPNYNVLYGKLVRSSRKAVIKTSGSRVLQWSGSLHVQLIWRHEIANSWPLNAACTRHEVSPSLFLSLCLLIWRGTLQGSFPAWEYWELDDYTTNLKRQV